jgi:hypothetical protein
MTISGRHGHLTRIDPMMISRGRHVAVLSQNPELTKFVDKVSIRKCPF